MKAGIGSVRPVVVNLSDQIGERLRRARESMGLTVEDVVYQAHLPRSVIEALEAEDFSVFASPTYAKSFLTQYSAFLEVDALHWLDALEPAVFVGGQMIHPLVAPPEATSLEIQPKVDFFKGLHAIWPMVIAAVVLIGALMGYNVLEQKLGDPAPEPAASTGSAPTAVEAPVSERVSAAAARPVVPPVTIPEESTQTVAVKTPRAILVEELPPSPPRAIIVRD